MSFALILMIILGNCAAWVLFPLGGYVQQLTWGITALATGVIMTEPKSLFGRLFADDEVREWCGYAMMGVALLFLIQLLVRAAHAG